MGFIAALEITEGIPIAFLRISMKLILLTTLASLALADPHYGYGYGLYGPGIAAHPGLATSYTHRSPQGLGKRSAEPEPHLYGQYAWPSVSGPYYTATCWGCRGKRSADAEPEADAHLGYGYAGYGYGLPGYSYASFGTPYHYLGKRSADAEAHGMINNVNRVSGLSPFPSYHSAWPGATVMVNHMGKRSADAHGMINNVNRVSGLSPFPSYTAAWPGATVMVNHMGKRSADPHYMGGVAGHPYGATSYVGRTVWGFPSMGHHYGKRSADADPHMPMTGIAMHPGGGTSYVGRTVWGFPLGK